MIFPTNIFKGKKVAPCFTFPKYRKSLKTNVKFLSDTIFKNCSSRQGSHITLSSSSLWVDVSLFLEKWLIFWNNPNVLTFTKLILKNWVGSFVFSVWETFSSIIRCLCFSIVSVARIEVIRFGLHIVT